MATSTTCKRCDREVMMTRMSMVDFKRICYPCERKEKEAEKEEVYRVSLQGIY